MVEQTWPELGGKQLRYADGTWELTGTVDVRGTGEMLAVEVRRVDDIRGGGADLRFVLENPAASLNPGNLGDHFDEIDRSGRIPAIVVKTVARRYRYSLQGIEHH